MKNKKPNLKIGLLENSCHSLKRGYELWSQWNKIEDAWLLKESIIWVHHGIELILKYLLVQTNAFLVFDKPDDAIKKIGTLRIEKKNIELGILDLFEHDIDFKSIGFEQLSERTAIVLSISELNKQEPLRLKIDNLQKLRNKIIHFSTEIDVIEVVALLEGIFEPLLEVLNREVTDEYFKKHFIPEIRKIAKPVHEFSNQIFKILLDNAIQSTKTALPPNGNRKAGIFFQTAGINLGTSVISYIKKIRNLQQMSNNHVLVLTNTLSLKEQLYKQIVDDDNTIQISTPKTRTDLTGALQLKEPTIIMFTFQKLDRSIIASNKEVLIIGYDLHLSNDALMKIFPNATFILFCTTPLHTDSISLQVFGELIGDYNLTLATYDNSVVTRKIEKRKISRLDNDYIVHTAKIPSYELSLMTVEFLKKLAQDIVEHFELRQKEWLGKGIIIIPDLNISDLLYKEIISIRPDWCGDTKENSSITKISFGDIHTERNYLLERFQTLNDSLSLVISTGALLIGLDNKFIHTIYVTYPISEQLRSSINGIVSRKYEGKENGLIVDYAGLNWDSQ